MKLPEEIKNQFGGSPFLNIGDETCSFFCPASILLKEYSQSQPNERNKVAHEFLTQPPNKQDYQSVCETLLNEATKQMTAEFYRYKDKKIDYKEEFDKEWNCLMGALKTN